MASLLLIGITTLLLSCREPTTVAPSGNPPDTEVNRWVYDNMKTWYFWNDKLPASPDFGLTPKMFFQSLLYRYDVTLRPDGDRFSWIEESADQLRASLSGQTTSPGLEYRLNRYAGNSNDVFGTVLYVIKGSSAEKAGFRRGDFFTHVDGQKLTTSNHQKLLRTGDGIKKITLGRLDAAASAVVPDTATRSVTPGLIQSDPVYFDTVFVRSATRVGYLVYHQFIPGPSGGGGNAYDQKLEAIFADFKRRGVNELIVDFRYNRGGYVSSATQLASLIGRGVSAKDVFFYKEYNKTVTLSLQKQYGNDFFQDNFLTKSQNLGGNLSRVYFLTSGATASASELVINGLKPYMPVFMVGGTTSGKNVGSITLSDNTKRIKWGIQPIVSRSANSQRNSNYTAGFMPDVARTEGLRLYAYGDARDALLGEALGMIFGAPVRRGVEASSVPAAGPEVYVSIERQAAGGNMFFELPARQKE